jgi:hypothetical protein
MARPTTVGNNYYSTLQSSGNRASAPGPLTGGTTIPGNGSSGIVPVDYRDGNFQMTCAVMFSAGASMTVTLQYTTDDILASDYQITGAAPPVVNNPAALPETSINWFSHPSLTGISANAISNIAFPVTAVRLICTVYGSGSAWVRLLSTPVAA